MTRAARCKNVRLLQDDGPAAAGRGAQRVGAWRPPVRHAARDDVRIDAAIPVAVEGAVVEDHGIIDARDDVGAGGIVEQQAQAVRVAPQVVRDKLIGAGSLREHARTARPGHAVTTEHAARDQPEGAPAGPLVDGIRTSSAGGGALGLVTRSVFSSNRVTGAGSAGVFAQRACANQFVSNDLRGNADGLGLLLNDSTGANVVTGVNNAVVLDNGAFDCDGDGGVDSNIITGGVAHRGPPRPDTLSSSTRSRGSIVLQ